MTNELQILIESLQKKDRVLMDILDKSKLQLEIASQIPFDVDLFDSLVDDKEQLLSEMDELDAGFDSLFQRIQDEFIANQSVYKSEIQSLQDLIRTTIDLGAQISATEARVKAALSNALATSKRDLKEKRVSAVSVSNYYRASNNMKVVESYFMDQKK